MADRPSRRTALKALGAASVAAALPAGVRGSQVSNAPLREPDLGVLRAIADVVLPSELGDAGRTRVVADFVRWLNGYRSGADTDHGYGFTHIRRTGPSPALAYPAQIAALGHDFVSRPPDARRAALESAIANAKVARLPGRPNGGHLATDLMAFYFHSPEAANRCYRARIDRDTCRGLPGSDRRPPAEPKGGTASDED